MATSTSGGEASTATAPAVINIADLKVNRLDSLGQTITCIYGRKPPAYAVYGSDKRLMICYADASQGDLSDRQRKDMAHLAPIRGEIDGLIDGWRRGTTGSSLDLRSAAALRSKAHRYNRRVADALIVALEGDLQGANAILASIKQEIIDERTAHGRFEYLIAALLTAITLMFGSWLVTSTYRMTGDGEGFQQRVSAVGIIVLLLGLLASVALFYARLQAGGDEEKGQGDEGASPAGIDLGRLHASLWPSVFIFALIALMACATLLGSTFVSAMSKSYIADYSQLVTLWRAAAAGSIGAFFSIAIGIRGRTILPDLLRTSNLMDAALRVSIGFIGAGVLMALLLLKAVTLTLGSTSFNGGELLSVLVAGFIAGFSERLVPDLLAKASAQTTSSPGLATPSARTATAPAGAGTPAGTEAPGAAANRQDAGAAASDPLPEEAHIDGCASDHAPTDEQVTRDADLPAASGGVAPTDEEKRP